MDPDPTFEESDQIPDEKRLRDSPNTTRVDRSPGCKVTGDFAGRVEGLLSGWMVHLPALQLQEGSLAAFPSHEWVAKQHTLFHFAIVTFLEGGWNAKGSFRINLAPICTLHLDP